MSSHNHDEPGHSHVPKNERKLAIAALLTGGFMFAEVIGGVVSGSLALIADAGHMLTDFASLVLAWFAIRLARKPADWKLTYGFDRFSVLAALVNGLSLFAIAIWITIEAIHRFRDPQEILGGVMLWVALGGLLVNLLSFFYTYPRRERKFECALGNFTCCRRPFGLRCGLDRRRGHHLHWLDPHRPIAVRSRRFDYP